MNRDIVITGGGVIGLCIARSLALAKPTCTITLLEKENELGTHTSTNNSAVLHSGIYYTPGSNKANLCVKGNKMLTDYFVENNLPILRCGKLVVAKNEDELQKLHELFERGKINGTELEMVDQTFAQSKEPHLSKKLKYPMIWSPNSSVGNGKALIYQLYEDLKQLNNVNIIKNEGYSRLISKDQEHVKIETLTGKEITSKLFINSAGLHADRIAHEFGEALDYKSIPLKGIYAVDNISHYESGLKTLVYPVPPIKGNNFLGVHTTLLPDGRMKLGPTAVPALWRENYTGFKNFKIDELMEILGVYLRIGFSSKVLQYFQLLLNEVKKSYGPNFIKSGQNLVDIYDDASVSKQNRFTKAHPGIRSQLIDIKTLELLGDFVFLNRDSHIHLLNMASPGWTCSMAIGDEIRDMALDKFKSS